MTKPLSKIVDNVGKKNETKPTAESEKRQQAKGKEAEKENIDKAQPITNQQVKEKQQPGSTEGNFFIISITWFMPINLESVIHFSKFGCIYAGLSILTVHHNPL